MKKRLLLVPAMAGLLLSGCKITLFGKTFYLFEKDPGDGGDDIALTDSFKLEFDGYKMAKSVKDGGKYILADYRINEDKMLIANGNYHSDDDGSYSCYFGCSTNVSDAAEITVKFLTKDTFSMKVSAPGKPWDGKYIGLYAGRSGHNNYRMFIALLSDPKFTGPYSDPTYGGSWMCTGVFKYYKSYDGMPAYAPGAPFQHQEAGDTEATPKFIGTGHNQADGEPDYVSMDSKSYEVALQNEAYDLAHLYEKK